MIFEKCQVANFTRISFYDVNLIQIYIKYVKIIQKKKGVLVNCFKKITIFEYSTIQVISFLEKDIKLKMHKTYFCHFLSKKLHTQRLIPYKIIYYSFTKSAI